MQIRIEISEPQDVVNAFLFLAEYIFGNGTNPHRVLEQARPDFGIAHDDGEAGVDFVPLDQEQLDRDLDQLEMEFGYTPVENARIEGDDA